MQDDIKPGRFVFLVDAQRHHRIHHLEQYPAKHCRIDERGSDSSQLNTQLAADTIDAI